MFGPKEFHLKRVSVTRQTIAAQRAGTGQSRPGYTRAGSKKSTLSQAQTSPESAYRQTSPSKLSNIHAGND